MSAPVPAGESPSIWRMYRAMVGVGVACALLIVAVFQWTAPTIALKRAEALHRAIFDVLPGARSSRTFRLLADGGFEPLADDGSPDERVVHAGYDAARHLVGLAVEAEGMGYQDVIRLLYGYSFEQDAIIGIRVLESRETPGLGDRIESDPAFLANFEHLDVSLAPDGASLAHAIEPVKTGTKEHPWQVDVITGATISSTAIATILDRSARWWVPRVRGHRDAFRAGSGAGSEAGSDGGGGS